MRMQLWVERVLYVGIILLIVIAGFGQAVLQLWNWLVPELFGLPHLTFWQAVGLLCLCWLLFGGMRGLGLAGGRGGWPTRWDRMTPEERQRFRAGLRAARDAPDAGRSER